MKNVLEVINGENFFVSNNDNNNPKLYWEWFYYVRKKVRNYANKSPLKNEIKRKQKIKKRYNPPSIIMLG